METSNADASCLALHRCWEIFPFARWSDGVGHLERAMENFKFVSNLFQAGCNNYGDSSNVECIVVS